MHLRIVRGNIQPGQLDAFVKRWREGIGAQLPSAPGFRQGYMTGNRETNVAVGITRWDTHPGATLDQRIQEAAGTMRDIMAGPPEIEDYEVLATVE